MQSVYIQYDIVALQFNAGPTIKIKKKKKQELDVDELILGLNKDMNTIVLPLQYPLAHVVLELFALFTISALKLYAGNCTILKFCQF